MCIAGVVLAIWHAVQSFNMSESEVVMTNLCLLSAQLDLAKQQGLLEKQREFLWRISDSYEKAGYLDMAENHLKELLEQELSEEQKVEALCFLADIQVCSVPVLGIQGVPSCSFCSEPL